MDHFCYICLLFGMLSRLFIAALWSPSEGKGLTSWLLFVMLIMILLLPVWYPGTGVVLNYIDSRSLLPFLFFVLLHSCCFVYVFFPSTCMFNLKPTDANDPQAATATRAGGGSCGES